MSTKANAQMRADGSESVQKFTCSLARAHVEILQDPMVPADIGKILASDSVTQTQFSTKRCQLKTPHRWMDSPVTSSEGGKRASQESLAHQTFQRTRRTFQRRTSSCSSRTPRQHWAKVMGQTRRGIETNGRPYSGNKQHKLSTAWQA